MSPQISRNLSSAPKGLRSSPPQGSGRPIPGTLPLDLSLLTSLQHQKEFLTRKTAANQREIKRQLIHLTGVLSIPLAVVAGAPFVVVASLTLASLLSALSIYSSRREVIKSGLILKPSQLSQLIKVERMVFGALDSVARQFDCRTKLYEGAISFFLAAGLSYLLLPFPVATLTILILTVCDSFSTLVGRLFGQIRFSSRNHKTWEGTVGGFLAALFSGLVLAVALGIPAGWVLLAAFVGSTVEASTIEIDDNLLIPIAVASSLLIASLL